jgi:pimeloyl-ACP methyl ester carboxylesterase
LCLSGDRNRNARNSFVLSDGRLLGFAEFGDPAGAPVVYLHGWPASRLEAAVIPGLPCRLIAVDRPGYGLSSAQRQRTLLDLPRDVGALAAHLRLGGFSVVGVSGGAPFALACAFALPAVRAVALVSPLPPLADERFASNDSMRRLRWLGHHPVRGRLLIGALRAAVGLGLADPRRALDGASAPADRACLTEAAREGITASWREGLRAGGAGALADARIYVRDWGFDLARIETPITIWHGAADRVVPVQSLRAYDAVRATRHVLDGEGHYSVALCHARRILATLGA